MRTVPEQLVTVSSQNTNENPASADDLSCRGGFPREQGGNANLYRPGSAILAAFESVK